jgi:hypothetical protein
MGVVVMKMKDRMLVLGKYNSGAFPISPRQSSISSDVEGPARSNEAYNRNNVPNL